MRTLHIITIIGILSTQWVAAEKLQITYLKLTNRSNEASITVRANDFGEIKEFLPKLESHWVRTVREWNEYLEANPGTTGGMLGSPHYKRSYSILLIGSEGEEIDEWDISEQMKLINIHGEKMDKEKVEAWFSKYLAKVRLFSVNPKKIAEQDAAPNR